MKNYEEMAQSVLKRRDIEIKRRKRAFLIGAPCAAAVLVGVVGIGTVAASQSREQPVYLIHFAANSSADYGEAELMEAVSSVDMIATTDPEPIDYTNPNAGQNDIKVLAFNGSNFPDNVKSFESNGFDEFTLEQLDRIYRLRLNRLGELNQNWMLSYDKLGQYTHEYLDNRAGVNVMVYEITYDRNTLNYTTESGAKVSVSAQGAKFTPISGEQLTADKPVKYPKPESYTEYDENGNIIGQGVAGYDPTKNPPITPEPDEGVSTVNGYEALIYRNSEGNFLADLNMSSRVRITAEGLSEEEFLKVLDDFTK